MNKDFLKTLKEGKGYQISYVNVENVVSKEFVKDLRNKLNMTQAVFASVLGVTKKTIEKWEQGVNPIKGCSARLLYIINEKPDIIKMIYDQNIIEKEGYLINTAVVGKNNRYTTSNE